MSELNLLLVRVVSPWPKKLRLGRVLFDSDISLDEADGLLCYWAPDSELYKFRGRKLWYCCEPQCQFEGLGGGTWPAFRRRLSPEESVYHNHPCKTYRVPHITHGGPLTMNMSSRRKAGAVAVVSNHGGHPLRRHPDLGFRNKFITHPSVDLYGRSGWKGYRKNLFARRRAPGNYCGEIPGDWPGQEKRELLASYKVAVCLENMNEPFYFTEKFVEAACAGCVPVYRADPDQRQTILEGAAWIDPNDYGGDPPETMKAAIAEDGEKIRKQNLEWLRTNPYLARTSHQSVFQRIAQIFEKSNCQD